jgi:hypothetical protein
MRRGTFAEILGRGVSPKSQCQRCEALERNLEPKRTQVSLVKTWPNQTISSVIQLPPLATCHIANPRVNNNNNSQLTPVHNQLVACVCESVVLVEPLPEQVIERNSVRAAFASGVVHLVANTMVSRDARSIAAQPWDGACAPLCMWHFRAAPTVFEYLAGQHPLPAQGPYLSESIDRSVKQATNQLISQTISSIILNHCYD